MISPTQQAFWHSFAQAWAAVFNGFAMAGSCGHCFHAGLRQSSRGLRSLRCYPSPSSRSGPSQAGPNLVLGQGCADRACPMRYCFQIRDLAVESGAITTNIRGRNTCGSRLSSSLFSQCRWRVACRTPRRVVPPGLRPGFWSPMRPTATCLPGRSSVALRGLQPAASSLACRPATRATKLTAFGRITLTTRTIRADRPDGPFAFA
jgi:hypothetical protein